jgi:Type I restriction enzyme R protein N terminus (HSDR_N)
MVKVLQASKASLGMLEQQFGLTVNQDVTVLPEWEVAAGLEPDAAIALARVKRNYTYLLKDAPVLEETVKLVVLSPLLDLAGFYQAPFRIRTEVPVVVSSQDEDGIEVRGAIDALVVLETLWVVVIEAKMSDFSLHKALPQALSYMLASPQSLTYGLVTNGSEFLFVKLTRSASSPQYCTSRVFSLYAPGNELESVVQILRQLGGQIISQAQ